jgi:hypothetical protein
MVNGSLVRKWSLTQPCLSTTELKPWKQHTREPAPQTEGRAHSLHLHTARCRSILDQATRYANADVTPHLLDISLNKYMGSWVTPHNVTIKGHKQQRQATADFETNFCRCRPLQCILPSAQEGLQGTGGELSHQARSVLGTHVPSPCWRGPSTYMCTLDDIAFVTGRWDISLRDHVVLRLAAIAPGAFCGGVMELGSEPCVFKYSSCYSS